MKELFKHSFLLLVLLFCTKCEFDFDFDVADEPVHCKGDFLSGDKTGCIFVDLEPDISIDMPIHNGSNLDSISILDNGVYDVIFEYRPTEGRHPYRIILKDGVEVAVGLNIPSSIDWSIVFGRDAVSVNLCENCAYKVVYGEELCKERYKWKASLIQYFGYTPGDGRYFVPIKKKTYTEVLIGWIKMSVDVNKGLVIEEYAIQKPRHKY